MEVTPKDQSSVSGSKVGKSANLLRYPLRSGSKPKDDKSPSIASSSRRDRSTSSVSQSVGVLNLSAKEKSAKPPRRLSIPTKPTASPATKSVGHITPISEARTNRSGINKGKNDAPSSDVSRSMNKKKFTVLSSASYWLSHIKLSEAAAKHRLSLGFFKLAQEAGCENVQLLRDELKSYVGRYNSLDLGESVKEVLQSYEISESIEQLQVSVTCSKLPEEGSKSVDDDAHSFSSATGAPKLKPKSLNNSATSAVKESSRETIQKSNLVSKIKAPISKKTTNQSPVVDSLRAKNQKNSKNPSKQESNKEKPKAKTKAMKPADEEAALTTCLKEPVVEENKENMGAPVEEEMCLEA